MSLSASTFLEIASGENSLRLEILRRSYPEMEDYWDGNWLNARLIIRVPCIKADFTLFSRTSDLDGFLIGLKSVDATNEGEALYEALEEDLRISVTAQVGGQMRVRGFAQYPTGNGATLEFEFLIDRSVISRLIPQLENILSVFPIRGLSEDEAKRTQN